MPVARREIVDASEPGVYHCVSRCVRRAYLCGVDDLSGRDFSHRKVWVKQRLELLTEVFGIQILTYAVMSNHLHVVLYTRPDTTSSWSPVEVARRWLRICQGRDSDDCDNELDAIVDDSGRVAELRARLSSISWFMRCLNEVIARRANREDECTGRFWEGRFKCTRLLDDASIVSCMAYVDLNPIRAAVVHSLDEPQFTGAHDRLEACRGRLRLEGLQKKLAEIRSVNCLDDPSQSSSSPLPVKSPSAEQLNQIKRAIGIESKRSRQVRHLIEFGSKGSPISSIDEADYLELLDWVGRQMRSGRIGRIAEDVPPLLASLSVDVDNWLAAMDVFDDWFARMVGSVSRMVEAAQLLGKRWLRGVGPARRLFLEASAT